MRVSWELAVPLFSRITAAKCELSDGERVKTELDYYHYYCLLENDWILRHLHYTKSKVGYWRRHWRPRCAGSFERRLLAVLHFLALNPSPLPPSPTHVNIPPTMVKSGHSFGGEQQREPKRLATLLLLPKSHKMAATNSPVTTSFCRHSGSSSDFILKYLLLFPSGT